MVSTRTSNPTYILDIVISQTMEPSRVLSLNRSLRLHTISDLWYCPLKYGVSAVNRTFLLRRTAGRPFTEHFFSTLDFAFFTSVNVSGNFSTYDNSCRQAGSCFE
jgi:hypothetical protein